MAVQSRSRVGGLPRSQAATTIGHEMITNWPLWRGEFYLHQTISILRNFRQTSCEVERLVFASLKAERFSETSEQQATDMAIAKKNLREIPAASCAVSRHYFNHL